MGRREHRGTLLRLALALMTSDSHSMTRGEPNSGKYVYQCPNDHVRRLSRYRRIPPMCDVPGCGERTKFVTVSGRS
ncbi:hypothetical protein ACWED2_28240 [Amycolatopsis sp. NPDC005003]